MIGLQIYDLKTFIRKEDEHLNTFTAPTIKFNLKEGSMSRLVAPKLDLKKKGKTEECSTTYRSYQIAIDKT